MSNDGCLKTFKIKHNDTGKKEINIVIMKLVANQNFEVVRETKLQSYSSTKDRLTVVSINPPLHYSKGDYVRFHTFSSVNGGDHID